MFKRIFWFMLGGLAMLAGLFFLGGMLADKEFTESKSIVVQAPVEKVWSFLGDTKTFSESRHEVTHTEMLGTNAEGFDQWKEHTNLAGTLSLEITKQIPNRELDVRLMESSFGMTGTWKFELQPEGADTRVTVTEHSVTEGLFMRSLLNVTGRGANMDLLLKALKKGAENL